MAHKIIEVSDCLILAVRELADAATLELGSKLAPDSVTVAELVLIRALYGRPKSSSGVAEEMGVTRTRVSKIADALVAKSLVKRTPDENDGRAHTLELTKQGNALVPKLAAISERADAEFFADMAAWERVALNKALEKFAARRSKASKAAD